MKILKLPLFVLSLFLFVWIFLTQPAKVFANAVCDGTSPACVTQYVPYTRSVCTTTGTGIYAVENCTEITTLEPRCTIPQSGGGSCVCCYNDGCYLDCPVAPVGGGGGGGGGGATPVPPTATPATPANLSAVALQVDPADTSCAAIHTSVSGVSGTVFGFTASSANEPTPQTQSGATPVLFANQPPGSYTLTATPPDANYVVTYPCLYKNGVFLGYGWSVLQANGGDSVSWEVGYTYGTAWAQTQGGDVYASGYLNSLIPVVVPRVFSADGASGYPGVVTYGSSYDFDASPTSAGETLVSSENWLVKATRPTVDYYDVFYNRFGAPTATDNSLFANLAAVAKPAGRATPGRQTP